MSNAKNIYVLAAKQISAQQPLSESWMDEPVYHQQDYIRSNDPDYTQYLAPNVARRLGVLLKRALLCSQQVMDASGITVPDAIVTGTGAGCFENTAFSLDILASGREEFFKPTHFMQSTHNTIGSLIAIGSRCHGYNSTYSHNGVSFEAALMDAFVQLQSGRIQNALVGTHDEVTPRYFTLLKKIGFAVNGFVGEVAVSMMLEASFTRDALCRLSGMTMLYRPTEDDLQRELTQLLQQAQVRMEDVDVVMTGMSGNPQNNEVYDRLCPVLFPQKPLLRYKHLFGESYSASGLGTYASATCLHQQRIPSHLFVDAGCSSRHGLKHILCYNHFENKNHTLILLSSCGK